MYNFAIVEDSREATETIKSYISKYAAENGHHIQMDTFDYAEKYLLQTTDYDALFLDIELPGIDGVTCAQRVRERGSNVIIIFITNISRLAIRGYEVSAMDYILKPLLYSDFSFRLKRLFRVLERLRTTLITIKLARGIIRVSTDNIIFVEVQGHTVKYYLTDETLTVHASFSSLEKELLSHGFLKCNRCYIVNPRHITLVDGYMLKAQSYELSISRPQKKAFMEGLNAYYAKGGVSQ